MRWSLGKTSRSVYELTSTYKIGRACLFELSYQGLVMSGSSLPLFFLPPFLSSFLPLMTASQLRKGQRPKGGGLQGKEKKLLP
jgi:hypothetical protein